MSDFDYTEVTGLTHVIHFAEGEPQQVAERAQLLLEIYPATSAYASRLRYYITGGRAFAILTRRRLVTSWIEDPKQWRERLPEMDRNKPGE